MTDSNKSTNRVPESLNIIFWVLISLLGLGAILIVILFIQSCLESNPLNTNTLKPYNFIIYLAEILFFMGILVFVRQFLLQSIEQTSLSKNADSTLLSIEEVLHTHQDSFRKLESLNKLSDQAKSLIYHERELEALRETIHAMLLKQDYHSANELVNRMEQKLGMHEEATRVRADIETNKQKTVDEKIDGAVNRIQAILDRQDWSQAKREAKRLTAIFPNSPKVASLPMRIQNSWNEYKKILLKNYSEAVAINDVERSIELLKELDKYLTPQEGSALAESARDVFKKKLHNLGVQFAISVTDQAWTQAIATGENIIQEFPNSRMAREVKAKMSLLKEYQAGTKRPLSLQELIVMSDAQLDQLMQSGQISAEHVSQVKQAKLQRQQSMQNQVSQPPQTPPQA